MSTEYEPILAVTDTDTGLPVCRITAARDEYYDDGFIPADDVWEGMRTIVTGEPRLARRHHYFEADNSVTRDTPLYDAWERFSEEWREDDAVEALKRYARIFHPRGVVYSRTLSTGYSRGDWVDVLVIIEPKDAVSALYGDNPASASKAAQNAPAKWCKVAEAIARNQHYTLIVEEPEYTWDEYEDTVNIEWEGVDSIGGVLILEDFSAKELTECAKVEFSHYMSGDNRKLTELATIVC